MACTRRLASATAATSSYFPGFARFYMNAMVKALSPKTKVLRV